MSYVRFPRDDFQQIVSDGRSDNTLDRKDIVLLVKLMARHRLSKRTIREVIHELDPKTDGRLNNWISNAETAGYTLKRKRNPEMFFEINPALVDTVPPVEYGQRQVVDVPADPGDPEADPPVPPTPATYRDAYWSEYPLFVQRGLRAFAAASNGVDYYDASTVSTIEAHVSVLASVHIDDLPEEAG